MFDARSLTKRLSGLSVSQIVEGERGAIAIQFTNGSTLVVERAGDGVAATFREPDTPVGWTAGVNRPTQRQREYLEFITKYMARYGVAPAESDVARHFMVSAPSVNLMMRSLERRGFITRERNLFTGQAVPRSIRIVADVDN